MSEINLKINLMGSSSDERLNSDDHGGGTLMVSKTCSFTPKCARIIVHGGIRQKQDLVKSAARWMLGHTLGNRQAHYVELEINLVDHLKNTSTYGDVIWEDDNARPRMFTMDLCNHIRDRQLLKVLSHEIVHIRQYVKGDLKDYVSKAHCSRWKDKIIQTRGVGSTSYYDLPWEIEARREETLILNAFCEDNDVRFTRNGKVKCDD
jgi:hypothetical protein